jgi:hypothetical protein
MSEREGSLKERGLSPDAYDFYSRLQFHAGGTSEHLGQSWERPKRHNRGIERLALWMAVGLHEDCEQALAPRNSTLLLPPSPGVGVRYELQAGIRIVHGIMPFSLSERHTLRHDIEVGHLPSDEMGPPIDPALVERWHRWLWMDEQGEPQTNVEALGASAVLGEACERLNLAAREILGWPAGH